MSLIVNMGLWGKTRQHLHAYCSLLYTSANGIAVTACSALFDPAFLIRRDARAVAAGTHCEANEPVTIAYVAQPCKRPGRSRVITPLHHSCHLAFFSAARWFFHIAVILSLLIYLALRPIQ